MPGTLFVVATPIGNLDDITLRALRVLREATLIAAEDTRRTVHLLSRHGITTPTTSLHEHNEYKKAAMLVAKLQGGDSVALVSDAGTPTVADPGSALIRAAIDAGIRVEPIPGPNAAIAALSVSGLSTDYFTFLGFPPTRAKDRKTWFDRLARLGGVALFYEAPHRIQRTLADLLGVIGDRPIVVARELTKVHEELVRGLISQVSGAITSGKGEFTVVTDLGDTPDLRIFGHNQEKSPVGRRQAVADFAQLVGVAPNDLYRAIERLKNIGQKTE